MSTALELVYEYRHLLGKCRAGAGLSLDEIETVEAIESLFAAGATPFEASRPGLTAALRGASGKLWDKVELASAELDLVEVQVEADIEPGTRVELVVEDEELRLSYRFKACVQSVQTTPSGVTSKALLELVGLPLLVRRGPKSTKPVKNLPPRPSSEPRVVAA